MLRKQLPCIIASTEPGVGIAQRLGRSRFASKLPQKPQHNAKVIIRFSVLSNWFETMLGIYAPHGQAFFTENLRVRGHVIASPRRSRRFTGTGKQLKPVIAQL